MELLLVLLSATALIALGVAADRIGADLRGGYRVSGHADRTAGDEHAMRLELLATSAERVARVRLAGAGGPGNPLVLGVPDGRPTTVGMPRICQADDAIVVEG